MSSSAPPTTHQWRWPTGGTRSGFRLMKKTLPMSPLLFTSFSTRSCQSTLTPIRSRTNLSANTYYSIKLEAPVIPINNQIFLDQTNCQTAFYQDVNLLFNQEYFRLIRCFKQETDEYW